MKCKHCKDTEIGEGSNYCPTCGSNLTGHCITDKLLASEATKAHCLLNDLGVPNVDSERKGRFLTLVERITILSESADEKDWTFLAQMRKHK